jgi:glycine cleavage system aminomethyltransferase T
MTTTPLQTTALRLPLHSFHLAQGARMVPFAGYEMPVQYSGPCRSIYTPGPPPAFLTSLTWVKSLSDRDRGTFSTPAGRSKGSFPPTL